MKTVVALYNRFEDAQQAVRALINSGFDRSVVNMIASDENGKYSSYLKGNKEDVTDGVGAGAGIGAVLGGLGGLLLGLGALAIPGIGPVIAAGPIATALAGAGVGAVAGGVVGALVDMGIPEEHANAYADGIRRGGTLVAVQASEQAAREAQTILNQFNPADVNVSQRGVRGETSQMNRDETMPSSYRESAVPVTGQDRDMTGTGIPIIEEDINVGKRTVDRGGVRIEKNIEEHPVEEDINLRQEHVNVERKRVDRPATDADINAFEEGTFEVRETGEEPVVEKRSRVVEEVFVNKDVEDETKTIRDTVRRTDVNVTPIDREMDARFRSDYQTRFSSTGRSYDEYMPAYQYGYTLANDQRYRDYDWNRLEPIAREEWMRQGNRGAWEDFKEAIRGGWESFRRQM